MDKTAIAAATDEELFHEYAAAKDVAVRNELLERYLYIAQIVAKKFVGRGVEYEDLLQTASLALTRAIERFDINRGVRFTSFATPSLIGEIKNYFRDSSRLLRVPRSDGDDFKRLSAAMTEICERTGEYPTPRQLAQKLNMPEDRVHELMELKRAGAPVSLDATVGEGDDKTDYMHFVGQDDTGFDRIETKEVIAQSLKKLKDEEKRIIYERYFNNRTQKQVSEMLGVSQMQVSRLEKKILQKMRAMM